MQAAAQVQRAYGKQFQKRATRLDSLLKTYEIAINACAAGDAPLAHAAIQLLRESIDFSVTPELALNLESLYSHCAAVLAEGNKSGAREILLHMATAFGALRQA